MFVACAAVAFLLFHLYKISTVKVSISGDAIRFQQEDLVTNVELNDVKSVRQRGAVIILETETGEKKIPHFGMFGEFALGREFEALGLLKKGS